MQPSLFPERELFPFNNPSMVLYVEDSYNKVLNNHIQTKYEKIVESFREEGIDFYYLPYLLQNSDYKAILDYNRPYLHPTQDDSAIDDIYLRIKNLLPEPFSGSGLVWVESDNMVGYPISSDDDLIEAFIGAIADVILSKPDIESSPRFKIIVSESIEIDQQRMVSEPKTEFPTFDSGIRFMIVDEKNADTQFASEAYKLAEEIRIRIRQLKESGSLSLIGDVLEEIQGVEKQLSKVFITNDYRIFLKDYGMKEVVMPPLPKSLFILFLRHPEGILFKHLANYHDELLSIYRNMTLRENIDTTIQSIRAMTDPLNNSVNEKCSRIRSAFLEVIADDLAKNYYVTGNRGEPKMITLDRTLVEFQ